MPVRARFRRQTLALGGSDACIHRRGSCIHRRGSCIHRRGGCIHRRGSGPFWPDGGRTLRLQRGDRLGRSVADDLPDDVLEQAVGRRRGVVVRGSGCIRRGRLIAQRRRRGGIPVIASRRRRGGGRVRTARHGPGGRPRWRRCTDADVYRSVLRYWARRGCRALLRRPGGGRLVAIRFELLHVGRHRCGRPRLDPGGCSQPGSRGGRSFGMGGGGLRPSRRGVGIARPLGCGRLRFGGAGDPVAVGFRAAAGRPGHRPAMRRPERALTRMVHRPAATWGARPTTAGVGGSSVLRGSTGYCRRHSDGPTAGGADRFG